MVWFSEGEDLLRMPESKFGMDSVWSWMTSGLVVMSMGASMTLSKAEMGSLF